LAAASSPVASAWADQQYSVGHDLQKTHQPRTAAVQCGYNVSIYNVNIRATLQPNSSSVYYNRFLQLGKPSMLLHFAGIAASIPWRNCWSSYI